ncbi:MAG: bleomycin resistance family protein, partial [bacterium]
AKVTKDNNSIMLYLRNDFKKEIPQLKNTAMGGSFLMFFQIQGVDELYKKIESQVTVIQPLHKTDYGTKEFTIKDCNCYILGFSESLK